MEYRMIGKFVWPKFSTSEEEVIEWGYQIDGENANAYLLVKSKGTNNTKIQNDYWPETVKTSDIDKLIEENTIVVDGVKLIRAPNGKLYGKHDGLLVKMTRDIYAVTNGRYYGAATTLEKAFENYRKATKIKEYCNVPIKSAEVITFKHGETRTLIKIETQYGAEIYTTSEGKNMRLQGDDGTLYVTDKDNCEIIKALVKFPPKLIKLDENNYAVDIDGRKYSAEKEFISIRILPVLVG